jgi:hypothetical protein
VAYRFTDTLYHYCVDYQSDVARIVEKIKSVPGLDAGEYGHAGYVEKLSRDLVDAQADLMRMKMCAMEFEPEKIVSHTSRCGYGGLDITTRPDACLSFDVSMDPTDKSEEAGGYSHGMIRLPMSKSRSIKIAKAILKYYESFPDEYDDLDGVA